jgi:hypothetical protein
MFSDFRSVALLALCASLAACAATLPTAKPMVVSAAPAPPASVTASSPSNTPAPPATTPSAPATTPPVSDVDANLVKAGYSVMRRHAQVYYCRNEIITGQRIGTRVCLTAEQIQSERQNVKKAQDMLTHPGDRCTQPMCVRN